MNPTTSLKTNQHVLISFLNNKRIVRESPFFMKKDLFLLISKKMLNNFIHF